MKPTSDSLLLALDCGSPTVSVAVGRGESVLAERHLEIRHSSESLLAEIDQVLTSASVELRDLEGLVGLRGPGSFTGLRVGLSALLGLHQATGLPATAVSTLETLAHSQAHLGASTGTLTAAVDALKGEWFVQSFEQSEGGLRPTDEPSRVPAMDLELLTGVLVGYGVCGLEPRPSRLECVEPPPLAGVAISLASAASATWNKATLLDPLYLREPIVYGS